LNDFREEDRFLEVGAAAGYMHQFVPEPYVGVERSTTLVEQHARVYGQSCIYQGEADDLSMFGAKSMDHVFMFSVAQYFPDLDYFKRAVSEMKRVARKTIVLGDIRRKDGQSGRRDVQTEAALKHFTLSTSELLEIYPEADICDVFYNGLGNGFNATLWIDLVSGGFIRPAISST
jgi:hypothetical protein